MSAVDIFTAPRMKQIEDTTVVGGLVDANGNLLLSTRAGEEINAGNVVGPEGPGFTYRGAWMPSTPYEERDVLTSNGSTFVVTTEHTSSTTEPTADVPGANLFLWATKGQDGTDGTDGTDGLDGMPGDSTIPAGTISLWVGDVAPTNWMICDGSAVSRTTYASLFSVIGNKYGAGDGVNTFNLPNLKGKTPVGLDTSQTEFNALAKIGGEKAHLLTTAEMPSHTHGFGTGVTVAALAAGATAYFWNAPTGPDRAYGISATASTGGGTAHNILQPYAVVNFIIKVANGDTPGDSQLTQRVSALEVNTSQWKMKGTISSTWTVGNPKVTLTDGVVVTAIYGSRAGHIRPGDEVLCENVSGSWYILEIIKANGPTYTHFLPLPTVPAYPLRPWYPESVWVLRGEEFRDLAIGPGIWMTKNSSGVVSFQGLGGAAATIPAFAVFATLPVGFRPSTARIFVCTINEVRGWLEIKPNGDMLFGQAVAAGVWVSISNAIFHDAAQDLNWIVPTTFYNGFGHQDTVNYPLAYAVDQYGYVWGRGLVKVGAVADNNAMFLMPPELRPAFQRHFAGASNQNGPYFGARAGNPFYLDYKVGPAGGGNGTWISLDGLIYAPYTMNGIFTGYGPGSAIADPLGAIPWLNAWVNYDAANFGAVGFTKRPDGLVYWQGFIKGGAAGTAFSHVPHGYRSLQRISFERVAAVTHARVAIDPIDRQIFLEVGSNSWASIDGLAYQAAR